MLHKLLGRGRQRDPELWSSEILDDVTEGCCKHCRRRFMMDGRARNSGGLLEPAAHRRLIFSWGRGVECTPLKNGGLRINSSNLSLRRRRLLYNDGCVGIYTPFIVGVKSESLSSPSHPHAFPSPFLSLPLAASVYAELHEI